MTLGVIGVNNFVTTLIFSSKQWQGGAKGCRFWENFKTNVTSLMDNPETGIELLHESHLLEKSPSHYHVKWKMMRKKGSKISRNN